MRRNEQLRVVIDLACLTEHRTDREQRALIAIAWEHDKTENACTTANRWGHQSKPGWEPTDLVMLVHSSRVEEDGDKPVPVPKDWTRRWETWRQDGGERYA